MQNDEVWKCKRQKNDESLNKLWKKYKRQENDAIDWEKTLWNAKDKLNNHLKTCRNYMKNWHREQLLNC